MSTTQMNVSLIAYPKNKHSLVPNSVRFKENKCVGARQFIYLRLGVEVTIIAPELPRLGAPTAGLP